MTGRLHSFTLADMVREQARDLPDAPAVVDGETRLTFTEMAALTETWAARLAGRGVGPGDRVAWLGPGDVHALALLFATARLGATLVPLNLRGTEAELAAAIRTAAPVLVLTTAGEHPRATAAAPATRVADVEGHWPADADAAVTVAVDDDDERPVLGIFTAAFSGRPRLALLSHRAIITQSLVLAAYRLIEPGRTRYLASGPMFHVGVFVKLLATYLFGGVTVLAPEPDPERLCRLIERERVTSALLFTPTIDRIVELNADRRFDLSSLRDVPAGPSGPDGDAWYTMTSCARPDPTGYGQTETYAMVTLTAREPGGAGAFGRPSPVVALRVADATGAEMPAGSAGEILVRGPQVMARYADADPPADGWHHTGDLGVRHPDGTIDFLGPIEDVIKTGMENVYPAEVEIALRRHPAVEEVCVLGVPDARWGESVRAVVEPAGGCAVEVGELIEHTRRHIASYKKPRSVILVDKLPRNGGRIDRERVRAQWGSP